MEVIRRFFDRIAPLKTTHVVAGFDGVEAFIAWKGDTSCPSLVQAQRLANALQPIVERQGCTIGIETATSASPGNRRSGLVAWQLVVSPGEGQSIGTFESSLQAIVETLEDPSASVVRPEETDLQAFVLRFSQAIRSAVTTNKHDNL